MKTATKIGMKPMQEKIGRFHFDTYIYRLYYICRNNQPIQRGYDMMTPDELKTAQNKKNQEHLKRATHLLDRILNSLPTNRDWLDPALEMAAIDFVTLRKAN